MFAQLSPSPRQKEISCDVTFARVFATAIIIRRSVYPCIVREMNVSSFFWDNYRMVVYSLHGSLSLCDTD